MWLVVGLGNPDAKYRGTRHNVGFEVVDLLAERATTTLSEKKFKAQMAKARLGGTDVVLLEPQTYMNLSGESVGPALGFYKLGVEQVLVVHDELDLELGKCRLKKGGGHGGHNGLRSLIQHLPSAEFIRVRVGIGRPCRSRCHRGRPQRRARPRHEHSQPRSEGEPRDADIRGTSSKRSPGCEGSPGGGGRSEAGGLS